MIYIKYTWKTNPNRWSIWAHKKGSKEEILILNYVGNTKRYSILFNLKYRRKYWKIKYLTPKEIDLLKLELL